jgi:preprotein translocase subunit SecG
MHVTVVVLLQPSKSGSSSSSGAHYRQLIASVNTVMPDIGACLERLLGYATATTTAGKTLAKYNTTISSCFTACSAIEDFVD